MTYPGTVVNGVILLDPPQHLPDGTRVEVVVQAAPADTNARQPTLSERLLKHAGTVTDLPPDLSERKGTLADFLEGSIGVLSSSEHVPGGARMSEDTGKKFAAGLVQQRQQGRR